MKKNIWILLVIISVVVFSFDNSYAFFGKRKDSAETESVEKVEEKAVEVEKKVEKKVAKKVVKKTNKSKDKVKELRKKKKTQMNNTMWDISIIHMSGQGKKKADVLMFKDNQYASKNYKTKGFDFSNYTLNVKDDGKVIWETMQTAQGGEVIFWRGEVNDKLTQMRGVLSVQLSTGDSDDYSFISQQKKPYKE